MSIFDDEWDDSEDEKLHREVDWEMWYGRLSRLASAHDVSVADRHAWRDSFDRGQTVEDALYEEYPEYRFVANAEGAAPTHKKPCRECPFRRASAPGWLGAMGPGEFLALADSQHKTPCHLAVSYEADDWQEQAKTAPHCAGRAIFLANRAMLPAGGAEKRDKDQVEVFTRPHEFVAHHANLPVKSLETTPIHLLYQVPAKRAVAA